MAKRALDHIDLYCRRTIAAGASPIHLCGTPAAQGSPVLGVHEDHRA